MALNPQEIKGKHRYNELHQNKKLQCIKGLYPNSKKTVHRMLGNYKACLRRDQYPVLFFGDTISLQELAKNIRLASNSSRLACLSLPSARVLALKIFATMLSSPMAIFKTSLLVHTMSPMVSGRSSLHLSLREPFSQERKINDNVLYYSQPNSLDQ